MLGQLVDVNARSRLLVELAPDGAGPSAWSVATLPRIGGRLVEMLAVAGRGLLALVPGLAGGGDGMQPQDPAAAGHAVQLVYWSCAGVAAWGCYHGFLRFFHPVRP